MTTGKGSALPLVVLGNEQVARCGRADLQVGTHELDEAAHYLIERAHELRRLAERDRPDLLVEVSLMPAHLLPLWIASWSVHKCKAAGLLRRFGTPKSASIHALKVLDRLDALDHMPAELMACHVVTQDHKQCASCQQHFMSCRGAMQGCLWFAATCNLSSELISRHEGFKLNKS